MLLKQNEKIGLFFPDHFNPIHIGHLNAIIYWKIRIWNELWFDKLAKPFRMKSLLKEYNRLDMVQLAVKLSEVGRLQCRIFSSQPGYTIDTLAIFKYPDHSFSLQSWGKIIWKVFINGKILIF